MYLIIYFNEKPLILTTLLGEHTDPYIHHNDTLLMDELSIQGIHTMLHEMQKKTVHAGIYLHENLDQLKHQFWKHFTVIQAAGGWVTNENNQVLFMQRRGKWDLPKGKLDPNETLEQCAIREVEEETGLQNLTLVKPLLVTYHTYIENGKLILKESHWYHLKVTGPQHLQPQTEEQITSLEWMQSNKLTLVLENTFQSIKDVIEAAKKI